MADLNCIKPIPCPQEPEQKEIYPPETPAFTFCAGKYNVSWDGARLLAEVVNSVPDGEYSSVTVVDGCIVGYGNSAAPTYTPPYCNPNPAPCGDGSGGVGYSISPQAGNILEDSALGLYARSYVQGTSGITVTGSGTEANPYKVANSNSSGVVQVVSDSPRITIDNTVPSSPGVGLTPSTFAAGNYGGFSIDSYGFVVGYSDDSGDVVGDVTAGLDIAVSSIGGTYNVAHTTQLAGNTTVQLGAYEVRISGGGHIESTARNVNVESGIYAVDGWLITVSTMGTITNIVSDPEPAPLPSMAIIDIIDMTYIADTDKYRIQGLSAQQPTNYGGNGAAYSFTMPPYVIDEDQITVIGGGGLTVTFTSDVPVKVQVTSLTASGADIKFVIRGA